MKHINEQEYNNLMEEQENLVLLDFFATWCFPCKMLSPILEEIEEEFQGKNIIFAKVDVDELEKASRDFSIMAIPTIVAIKNGKEKARISGVRAKEDLVKFINENL